MLPIGDFLGRRTTPYVNWTLIAVNVAVFLYTITLSADLTTRLGGVPISEADKFYYNWGELPACLAEALGIDSGAGPASLVCPETKTQPFVQVFTAMFLHAGWGHLIFNMLFLWIFGDNVEDRLGHLRYLIFYLVAGVAAMAAQTVFSLDSTVPTVGASGAIAGVMGAYIVMFPGALVRVILLPIFFIPFFVPASLLIGVWFLMQVLGGVADIGQTQGTGIAFWAHVGGFLAGVVMVLISGIRGSPGPRAGYGYLTR
jgi:membrane associated rhomboid family serine protease